MIYCSLRFDICSGVRFRMPPFLLFVFFNQLVHYYHLITLLLFSEYKKTYLKFEKFGEEIGFFESELFKLGGKNDIGEMESAIFVIIVELLLLSGFVLYLMIGLWQFLLVVMLTLIFPFVHT